MREIKFRGYCSYDKKIYSPVYFDNLEVWWWNPKTEEAEILGDRLPNSMLIHIEVMQYTGLKDRNGKEIYEGDIIKGTDGHLYEIYFDEAIAAFCMDDNSGEIGLCNIHDWGYVVGNTHENTELLKGEK